MKFVFLEKSKTPSLDNVMIEKNSVVLLSTGFLPTLNLDDELLGVTNHIKALCVKSFQFTCTVLAGTTLLCKDKKYFGTLIVHNGKFLGISDMTHSVSGDFDLSRVIKVYETTHNRLGVVSGDDIFFFEVARTLRVWQSDILLFCVKDKITRKHRVLAESQGISNGVSVVLFGKDSFYVYNAKKIKSKCKNVVEIENKDQDIYLKKRRTDIYLPLVKKDF